MMRLSGTTVVLTVVIGSSVDAGAGREAGSARRDRRTFAGALATIRPGMTEREVLRVLGPSDDVRTETDPGGLRTADTSKVLRYGTTGHLSCATLGQVFMNRAGRVRYVFGGRGTPRAPELLKEPELTRLLTLLHDVGSYRNGYEYNPLPLIRAVNALHAAGRERALAVIGEYLRISSSLDDPAREGMFLVMRTLFDAGPEARGMPRMQVGVPSPPEPKDAGALLLAVSDRARR